MNWTLRQRGSELMKLAKGLFEITPCEHFELGEDVSFYQDDSCEYYTIEGFGIALTVDVTSISIAVDKWDYNGEPIDWAKWQEAIISKMHSFRNGAKAEDFFKKVETKAEGSGGSSPSAEVKAEEANT